MRSVFPRGKKLAAVTSEGPPTYARSSAAASARRESLEIGDDLRLEDRWRFGVRNSSSDNVIEPHTSESISEVEKKCQRLGRQGDIGVDLPVEDRGLVQGESP